MQERDLRLPDAGARRLVDQAHSLIAQPPEDGLDVVDLVGDVVQPRAALGEELADRRVVVERGEQLDVVLADEAAVPDRDSLEQAAQQLGATVELARVAAPDGPRHDPESLAAAYDRIFRMRGRIGPWR